MDPPFMAVQDEDGWNPQPQHPGVVVQQPGTPLPLPAHQQSLAVPMGAADVAWGHEFQCPDPVSSNPAGLPYGLQNQAPSAIDPRFVLQPAIQAPQGAPYHQQDSGFHPPHPPPPQVFPGPQGAFLGSQTVLHEPQGIFPGAQNTLVHPQQTFVDINQAILDPSPVFSQDPLLQFQQNNPFGPNPADAQNVLDLAVLLANPYPHTVSRNGLPHAGYGPSMPEPGGGPSLFVGQRISVPVSSVGGPLSHPLAVGQRFSAPVSPAGFGQRLSPPVPPSAASSLAINPPAAPIQSRATSVSPAPAPSSAAPLAGESVITTVPEVQPRCSPDPQPRNLPDSFPLFGLLPGDIRDAIWRLAVVPRTIIVDVAATRITGAPRPFRAATTATWRTREPTQGVLLACRESYRAAAALYARMPFPTPAFAAYGGSGGLEPADVPIAPALDTVEFSAGWLVDDDGFPVAAAARGASRREYDGPDTLRLLMPLVGLAVIDQQRQLWTPGWDGWAHRLRHISFNAVLVGHVAQSRRAGRGPDMGEIWDGLVLHMKTSPSFRTCTISIAVPETTTSDALARTSSQCDNIRRVRIARRPPHYAGATEDLDSECDLDSDGVARPPWGWSNSSSSSSSSSSRPSGAGGAPWPDRLPRVKRPGRLPSKRTNAMRLDSSDAYLLLDNHHLEFECRNHAPQLPTRPHHGSGRRGRLAPSYRHRIAIMELLDAEQVATFCPTRLPHENPLGFESRRREAATMLGARMRHHYCVAWCHVPQQLVHPRTWDLPAGPTSTAATTTAPAPTQSAAAAAAQPSPTEQRHFAFGDSFEGDMHLLLHNWVARYRDMESQRLNVAVHGVCREDFGW